MKQSITILAVILAIALALGVREMLLKRSRLKLQAIFDRWTKERQKIYKPFVPTNLFCEIKSGGTTQYAMLDTANRFVLKNSIGEIIWNTNLTPILIQDHAFSISSHDQTIWFQVERADHVVSYSSMVINLTNKTIGRISE